LWRRTPHLHDQTAGDRGVTPRTYAETLKLALLVVAVALIPLLIWYLFDLILVIFGAVILAMLLRLGAQPFMRWLSIPEPLALVV
jgi:predicted PurR-regulated permease PerM